MGQVYIFCRDCKLAKILIMSGMSQQQRVQRSLINSQQKVLVNVVYVGRGGTLAHPMIVSRRQDSSHAHTAPRAPLGQAISHAAPAPAAIPIPQSQTQPATMVFF